MKQFSLSKGVKWRSWADGIAVFVPSTCETHVFSPELFSVFQDGLIYFDGSPASADGPLGNIESSDPDPTLNLLDLLKTLKIIEVND